MLNTFSFTLLSFANKRSKVISTVWKRHWQVFSIPNVVYLLIQVHFVIQAQMKTEAVNLLRYYIEMQWSKEWKATSNCFIWVVKKLFICLKGRLHVTVHLFSYRSLMTPSVSLMFSTHFDVFYNLLLNRHMPTNMESVCFICWTEKEKQQTYLIWTDCSRMLCSLSFFHVTNCYVSLLLLVFLPNVFMVFSYSK